MGAASERLPAHKVWAAVIGAPCSAGFRAGFEGRAAVLANFNGCSIGVVVTNIDTGFGRGHPAARIRLLDRSGSD